MSPSSKCAGIPQGLRACRFFGAGFNGSAPCLVVRVPCSKADSVQPCSKQPHQRGGTQTQRPWAPSSAVCFGLRGVSIVFCGHPPGSPTCDNFHEGEPLGALPPKVLEFRWGVSDCISHAHSSPQYTKCLGKCLAPPRTTRGTNSGRVHPHGPCSLCFLLGLVPSWRRLCCEPATSGTQAGCSPRAGRRWMRNILLCRASGPMGMFASARAPCPPMCGGACAGMLVFFAYIVPASGQGCLWFLTHRAHGCAGMLYFLVHPVRGWAA